ncbi:MAG: hypothetical protein J2P35_05905 [Actinobacteria bacterium]|nr:hypothetical protein [Actinomycetota bacterium]
MAPMPPNEHACPPGPPVLAIPLAIALACVALAACGSARAGTPPSSGGLCASAGRVDRLVVERVNRIPRNHERFTFPARVTVTSPREARTVARALCALPPMPSGTFHCPADLGIVYRLGFTADGRKLPVGTIEATGCRGVRGLGRSAWTARSPGFWRLLAAAMRIGHPGASAFAGQLR